MEGGKTLLYLAKLSYVCIYTVYEDSVNNNLKSCGNTLVLCSICVIDVFNHNECCIFLSTAAAAVTR